jgi:hypothetical protein
MLSRAAKNRATTAASRGEDREGNAVNVPVGLACPSPGSPMILAGQLDSWSMLGGRSSPPHTYLGRAGTSSPRTPLTKLPRTLTSISSLKSSVCRISSSLYLKAKSPMFAAQATLNLGSTLPAWIVGAG